MCKKTLAVILAILMMLGCVSAVADVTKQEKVYVVSGADGTVKSVTDNVRLDNPDGMDSIADQTILAGIENLSGSESFTLEDGTLTWQADGNDIIYQGTSNKAPAIVPVVTITLDGEAVSAAELKEREGDAVLAVTYQVNEAVPALAITAMLLPETGVSGLQTENAQVMNEMGRQILVGYAVPGVNTKLDLPASFTASFHADHTKLDWMMTIVTTEPIRLACEAAEEMVNVDWHAELDEVTTILTAMSRNEALPETEGMSKDFVLKLNELNSGLVSLDDGAKQLADGAAQLYGTEADDEAGTEATGIIALSDGLTALGSGLETLTANNDALNEGGKAIFEAILETANAQIVASGLDAGGISIPMLTSSNYSEALNTAITQLDTETLYAAAYTQVEAVVRPQVEAQEAEIRAGVEHAVRGKVLEAVLAQLGLNLTVEQYEAAVQAGQVTADQAAQLNGAVESQMETDEVKAQVDTAVQEQIESLVKENIENYLASDETIQAKLAQAESVVEKLTTLKNQLDQVSTFVAGLKAYTDGASQAADGAALLSAGVEQLEAGAAQLAQGSDSLYTDGTHVLKTSILAAEAELAQELLPYAEETLPEALDVFEETLNLTRNAHYDLAPEGIRTTTLYLIRTDL